MAKINPCPLNPIPATREFKRIIGFAAFLCMTVVAGVNAQGEGSRVTLDGSIRPVSIHTSAVNELTPAHFNDQAEFQIALKIRNFSEMLARTGSNQRIDQKELTQKYLPTKAAYAAVRKWAESQELTVTQTDDNRLALYVKGSVSKIEAALKTKFARVTTGEGEFNSASTAPSIPSELADVVLGVNGLQPHLHPHNFLVKRQANNGGASTPYKVSDLLSAYNASALGETGSGQTIAILIDTVPSNSDLQAFWTNNGIPQSLSNISKINVRNVTLPAPSGEESLDAEWTSGIAPAAKIRIYATGDLYFTSLDKGFQRIISDLATQKTMHALSISLGLGEEEIATSQLLTDSQYLATIAGYGVSIFVSSGDNGSNPDGILQPSYYSSDSSVTGVGGTSMKKGSGVETGWNGSGGGVSGYFSRPLWQTGAGVISGNMRLVPDVASLADPNTGAYLVLNGQQDVVGGTSWSAPTWAGLSALINQARASAGESPLGRINTLLYPLNGTTALRDITSGNNGSYLCTQGFDLVTGLGSPQGAPLLQAVVSSGTAAAPMISGFLPTSGTIGTTVVISGTNLATVSNVEFNGVNAIFTLNSPTQIMAQVPVGALTGNISVTTLADQTAASSGVFTVIVPASTGGLGIAGFSPASGAPGTSVTVSGSGFSTATEVEFGDVSGSFLIDSSTKLTATVPAGAMTGPLTVISTTGTAISTGQFIVLTSSTSSPRKTLYSTAFSSAQGYSTKKALAGQKGWLSSGNGSNGVLNIGSGTFNAYLGYSRYYRSADPTFVWHPVDYTPTTSAPVVTFSTTLTVINSTNGASDAFDWAVFNSVGAFLFALDFDDASGKVFYLLNGQSANYVDTGLTFDDQTPYQLVVTMDYSRNTWSATLNGKSVVNGQAISQTPQNLDFGDADAVGSTLIPITLGTITCYSGITP